MQNVELYKVVWNSPSKDASGSMPIGNGDLGANVWVEEATGDVLLLLGKTDAWDENSINLKLGRIRISLDPNPFLNPRDFRMELWLEAAHVRIEACGIVMRVWADANQSVIWVEVDSSAHCSITARLEMWRTEERTIKTQTGDLFRDLSGNDHYPTAISPDVVLDDRGGRIVWCHHNERREHDGYEINMRLQGLEGMLDRMPHPLLGRTFGAAIGGEGFVSGREELTLESTAARHRHELKIVALTREATTIERWKSELEGIMIGGKPVGSAWIDHYSWWLWIWSRSWIDIASAPEVTRAYVLQRYMNACAGRGKQPIKFNGSIFTVGKPNDPDFRRWGGPGFWFMNQRLIYWPMLAAGDFDLLDNWLRMYLDMLPVQRHRTQKYYGHGGAHFPETMTFWGAEVSAHYGWTPFEERATPEAECPYVRYYWRCGIELSLILLLRFQYMDWDETFARDWVMPVVDAVTEFYDLHYPRDGAGRIRIEPAQALETWHEACDPLPEIAGLWYLLPKLLELPDRLTTEVQRARWLRMLEQLPNIPVREKDGKRVVLPAERFDVKKNTENPELYCVFPYRVFGVGKPELEVARETFAARLHRSHECWSQDEIQMAYLGLAEEAKESLILRASAAAYSESRFPGFWDAHHDWAPDMDHGGVLQMALQAMLLQCEGKQIVVLPAWPREWDVGFRLRAPYRTVVEGIARGGKLLELKVEPENRRGDVKLGVGWTM